MKEIQEAVENHVKDCQMQVARNAIERMKFIILNMKVNQKLLKPESMDTLVEWAEKEVEGFKSGLNKHHGLNL